MESGLKKEQVNECWKTSQEVTAVIQRTEEGGLT